MKITEIEEVVRITAPIEDLERIKIWYNGFKKQYYQSKQDEELMEQIDTIINRRKR